MSKFVDKRGKCKSFTYQEFDGSSSKRRSLLKQIACSLELEKSRRGDLAFGIVRHNRTNHDLQLAVKRRYVSGFEG